MRHSENLTSGGSDLVVQGIRQKAVSIDCICSKREGVCPAWQGELEDGVLPSSRTRKTRGGVGLGAKIKNRFDFMHIEFEMSGN